MGLDMYLSRKVYVKHWDHNEPENFKVRVSKGGKSLAKLFPADSLSYLEQEVCYWRKANHIHNWFVENVQDGEDDCRDAYVELDKLKELMYACEYIIEALDKCEVEEKQIVTGWQAQGPGLPMKNIYGTIKVFKDPQFAEEVLPTTAGFFFGGTEYDTYYYNETKRTAEVIKKILSDEEKFNEQKIWTSYYYSSSW